MNDAIDTTTNADFHWIDIGAMQDIPPQGARVVNTDEGDIAVFRTADDQLFALRDHCPHRGGPLSQGIVFAKRVACPLHNWVIELDGGNAVAPDQGCAPHYPVRLADGRIQLGLARTAG